MDYRILFFDDAGRIHASTHIDSDSDADAVARAAAKLATHAAVEVWQWKRMVARLVKDMPHSPGKRAQRITEDVKPDLCTVSDS